MGATSVTGVSGSGAAFPGNKIPATIALIQELITQYAITSINGISADFSTGEFTLTPGANITFTPDANGLTISSTGGGGGTAGFSHVVYVDPNGNDSTGNGSLSAPYQTITHALANLPSGVTLTNPCAIQLGAGLYNEATLSLKPNVGLIGLSYRSTRVIVGSGFIDLDLSGGNYTANCRNSIFGVSLSGSTGLNFNVSSLPFSSFVFDMGETWVNGAINFTGRVGGADYCQLYRGYTFNNVTITNGQGECNDLTIAGNLSVSCSAMTGGGTTEFDLGGCRTGGGVTYSSDGSRSQLAALTNSNIPSLTASGTGTVISADAPSIPTSVTLSGGASLTKLTPTLRIVSVPSTSSSTGLAGDFAVDSSFAYFCIAANTWVRSPVATW